jgi:hypothetical protein
MVGLDSKDKWGYANHPYLHSWKVNWFTKDAAQPDPVKSLLGAPLAATLWLMSDHGAQLRWKGELGANPNPVTHPVNISCGRKPEYPEKTHDFQ